MSTRNSNQWLRTAAAAGLLIGLGAVNTFAETSDKLVQDQSNIQTAYQSVQDKTQALKSDQDLLRQYYDKLRADQKAGVDTSASAAAYEHQKSVLQNDKDFIQQAYTNYQTQRNQYKLDGGTLGRDTSIRVLDNQHSHWNRDNGNGKYARAKWHSDYSNRKDWSRHENYDHNRDHDHHSDYYGDRMKAFH